MSRNVQFVPNVQYDESNITIESKLTENVRISRFLLDVGGTSFLRSITDAEKLQLARNLYMQALIIEEFHKLENFSNFRIQTILGVYRSEGYESGKKISYTLVNSLGSSDAQACFDFAVYLKDHAYIEKITLNKSTIHPSGSTNSFTVDVPNMTESFLAQFPRNSATTYNGETISETDLLLMD